LTAQVVFVTASKSMRTKNSEAFGKFGKAPHASQSSGRKKEGSEMPEIPALFGKVESEQGIHIYAWPGHRMLAHQLRWNTLRTC